MATLRTTVRKRAQIVSNVRSDFGKEYKVRKGWQYVLCQCKRCKKVFQVPFKEPGHTYARTQLRTHISDGCRG